MPAPKRTPATDTNGQRPAVRASSKTPLQKAVKSKLDVTHKQPQGGPSQPTGKSSATSDGPKSILKSSSKSRASCMITFKKDASTGIMRVFRSTDRDQREAEQRRQLEALGEVASQIRASEEVRNDWKDLFRYSAETEKGWKSSESSEEESDSRYEERDNGTNPSQRQSTRCTPVDYTEPRRS